MCIRDRSENDDCEDRLNGAQDLCDEAGFHSGGLVWLLGLI